MLTEMKLNRALVGHRYTLLELEETLEAFEGGSANGYELELGSNSFVPGFEDQLIGIKAGEHRTVNVTFPTNYVEQLKGKEARFEVTCHDVKEKVLPELNEEFFEELKIEDVKDEKSLKAYAKKQVLANKERKRMKQELQNSLIISLSIILLWKQDRK